MAQFYHHSPRRLRRTLLDTDGGAQRGGWTQVDTDKNCGVASVVIVTALGKLIWITLWCVINQCAGHTRREQSHEWGRPWTLTDDHAICPKTLTAFSIDAMIYFTMESALICGSSLIFGNLPLFLPGLNS